MPTEIVMPQMGAEMEEGTVLKWLKQPGDQVNRGDIIAEIETDKATVELDAFESGTFLRAVVEEGTKVPVGQVIAYLGRPGETLPDAPAAPAPAAARDDGNAPPTNVSDAGETMRGERTTSAADTTDPTRLPQQAASPSPPQPAAPPRAGRPSGAIGQRDSLRKDGIRLRVSPVARSMAEELGIDLALIKGTGRGGGRPPPPAPLPKPGGGGCFPSPRFPSPPPPGVGGGGGGGGPCRLPTASLHLRNHMW